MQNSLLNLDEIVECLKSAAEPSRLRILKLLSGNDLTVSDLTTILGQSQPRVSRHLKLLLEAKLINRWQEGSWALFRLNPKGQASDLIAHLLTHIDESDEVFGRDLERLAEVKEARRARASDYFSTNAKSWDEIRSLHVSDELVETALAGIVGKGPFNAMLDIGTGTGRMLELFAPYCRSAMGIDSNREMLNVARSNLDSQGIDQAEVRHGDVYNLALGRDMFDLIIIHQVLHFLDDPQAAVREAVRALAPAGKIVIVDFASHDQEFLRDQHQHQRLGFDDAVVNNWLESHELAVQQPAIVSGTTGTGQGAALTVKIWSATDTRYLMADQAASHEKEMA